MPNYRWPLWRPVIGWGTFSALAPVLSPQQKKWLLVCHPLPPFMAVSMMPNMQWWPSSCYYCMRHSWLTKLGWYAWTSSYIPYPMTFSELYFRHQTCTSPTIRLFIACFLVADSYMMRQNAHHAFRKQQNRRIHILLDPLGSLFLNWIFYT